MYHELREKEEALQNVEDPHMRAELENEFDEESAPTKRPTMDSSIRSDSLLFHLVDMRPRRSRFSSFTAKIYNIGIDNIYCQKQTGFIRVGNGESLKKIAGNFCADRSYTYKLAHNLLA
ncbi:hypothetical protein Tsp_15580 [Trichinella spiralis]|uniref:hypothetical protein n=1 Tax=Trichinella spiralis TaxID=6334 RepID=UPI0001EFEBFD|nr:hypothetical protein Tsp_15580 [Trichinella spiralis]